MFYFFFFVNYFNNLFVIGVGDDVGDINDCIIVIISISYFYLVGILYIWVFYFKLNISFSNGVI